MSADPSELIFFREITPERFFRETERLGVGKVDLLDHAKRDGIFHACLLSHRIQIVKDVAADLKLAIADDQANSIARNSLTPGVLPDPAPLTAAEREIAAELYYRAIRAAADRQGTAISEKSARSGARKMIRMGERGLTRVQKMGQSAGCLIVLAAVALGFGLVLCSGAAVLAALNER
jgi:hypothetical protein